MTVEVGQGAPELREETDNGVVHLERGQTDPIGVPVWLASPDTDLVANESGTARSPRKCPA